MILEKEEYTNDNVSKNQLIIMKTEDQLRLDLKQLIEYVDNFKQWIKITACIRNLLHRLMILMNYNFRIYGMAGTKKETNMKKRMDNLISNVNFNYFVDKYNHTIVDRKRKIEYFKTIKDYALTINDMASIK